MKASEIRIGNWVADRGGKEWIIDSWENPTKVASKPTEYYIPSLNIMSQFHPLTEEIDFLKPIPITKEWLLRFGFLWSEYNQAWVFRKMGIGAELIYHKEGIIEMESARIKCEFVHQLQNIHHALTGEELKMIEK